MADRDITIEDTSYTDFARTFWISGSNLLTTGGNQLNYLDTGSIPANANANFMLSYNPERENAFLGFDIEQYDSGILTIGTRYFSASHTTTDVRPVANAGGITVYPVPSADHIIVDGLMQGMALNITDAAGKALGTIVYSGSGRCTIDISSLPPGIYFANRIKFVKQ